MLIIRMECPECGVTSDMTTGLYVLNELGTVEDVESTCPKCGCKFVFDIWLDIMNKAAA